MSLDINKKGWDDAFQYLCTIQKTWLNCFIIIAIIIVIILTDQVNSLDQLQTLHDSAATTCGVLDFAAVLGLAINCNIWWKAMVDPMASISITTTHGLIDTLVLDGEKKFALWSLKLATKLSTYVHLYCSVDLFSAHSAVIAPPYRAM